MRLAKLSAGRPTPATSKHNPPSTSTALKAALGAATLTSPRPTVAAAAADGWGDGEDEPWEGMRRTSSSSNGSRALPAGVNSAGAAGAAQRRSATGTGQMRPAGGRTAGAAASSKSGAMKLGATKLGATKLDNSML